MRTPWKFLADLVSRKPSSSTDQGVADQAFKAIDYRTLEPEIIPPESNSIPALSEPGRQVIEPYAPEVGDTIRVRAEPERSPETEVADLMASTAIPEEISALDAAQRAEETISATTGRSHVGEIVDEQQRLGRLSPRGDDFAPERAVRPATQLTPREEMLLLDEEIRKLRLELGRKLSVQNAHLRKLLGRYERQ